jgi:tetratricopeptide (TPR) repeat protein
LLKKGFIEQAAEMVERAELVSPQELEIQFLKARIYIHQRQFNEAILLIDDLKAIATHSDLEDIYLVEAFFYENVQEFDLMFQCVKKALIINPNSEEALYAMNAAVEQSKNYEESILLHKVIVDNHPYNHLAWFNLGHSYASVGEYEKAIDALEYVYIISPQFEQAYLDCAQYCCELQQYDKALEIYEEALGIFGAEFDLLLSIAHCQYAIFEIDKAKRTLFEAIEMDSYSDEAYFLLAKCYMHNRDWNSAVKVLHKAISIECEVEEYFHALGMSFQQIDDNKRALYYLRKAAIKGCEQAVYWEDYVSFLVNQGDYKDAINALEDADRYTFSYRLQYLEAACFIGLGDIKKGLTSLEEALQESYEDHDILIKSPPAISENKEVMSIIAYYKN